MSRASGMVPLSDPSTTPDDPLHAGPFEAMRENYHLLRELLGEILSPFEILPSDLNALRRISRGPLRPGEISDRCQLSPAAVTDLLDRLETKGLLLRERDPGDRRATQVRITPKGRALVKAAGERYFRFLEEVLGELSPSGRRALESSSSELREILSRRSAVRRGP